MYGIFILCPFLILQHWRSRQLGPEPHFLESHCIVRTFSLLSIVAPIESFFWIFRFSKSDCAPKGGQPKMMSFFTLSLTCYSPLALSSLSSWLVVLTVFLTALKIHKMPKIHNNPLNAEGTIQLQFDSNPPPPSKNFIFECRTKHIASLKFRSFKLTNECAPEIEQWKWNKDSNCTSAKAEVPTDFF